VSEFSSSIAVITGINDYGNGVPPLETPTRDAVDLAERLARDYGYDPIVLLNEAATRSQLLRLLTETLKKRMTKDSRLLFYFAGHGVAVDSGESHAPEGYLLTQDAESTVNSFLAMRSVYEALSELPCRHLLVILDCCFAGTFRWASGRDAHLKRTQALSDERYRHYIRHRAWQSITSAAYNERAQDVTVGGKAVGRRGRRGNHSPFAQALLDGLGGRANLYPDGIITVTELAAYLQQAMWEDAQRQWELLRLPSPPQQTPQLWLCPSTGRASLSSGSRMHHRSPARWNSIQG
jgi:hypothetical protein